MNKAVYYMVKCDLGWYIGYEYGTEEDNEKILHYSKDRNDGLLLTDRKVANAIACISGGEVIEVEY